MKWKLSPVNQFASAFAIVAMITFSLVFIVKFVYFYLPSTCNWVRVHAACVRLFEYTYAAFKLIG